MLDVFLGETYDKRKRLGIARAQKDLHRAQEKLAKEFHEGRLAAEKYADSVNLLINEAFAKCEKILGRKDFEKLLGASWAKESDFVDRSEFLRAHGRQAGSSR